MALGPRAIYCGNHMDHGTASCDLGLGLCQLNSKFNFKFMHMIRLSANIWHLIFCLKFNYHLGLQFQLVASAKIIKKLNLNFKFLSLLEFEIFAIDQSEE